MPPSGEPGSEPGVSRRRLLATVGAVGSIAGCSGVLDGDGPATATDAGTATATETTTATDTATATETRTPAAGTLDPADYGPPGPGDWKQTLADHFDAGELDGDTWSVGIEGHHDGDHCADQGARSFCWGPEYVSVDDERNRLRLRVTDEAPSPDERDPDGIEANYAVGAVTSRGKFAQEFGYFEVAARIPDQPGTLPACWLFLDKFDHDWREIELYEKNGSHDANTLKMGTWFERDPDGPDPSDEEFDDNGDRIHVGAGDGTDRVRVADPVDETFHVIGLEWAPDALTWYVDGEAVGRVAHPGVAEHLPGRELFLVLNSAVFEGADWLGSPADARFPHYHEFEWVRAWQRENWRSD